MYVWLSHKTEYRSTGKGCQSCSWSAEQGKYIFLCSRSSLRIWSRETGRAPSGETAVVYYDGVGATRSLTTTGLFYCGSVLYSVSFSKTVCVLAHVELYLVLYSTSYTWYCITTVYTACMCGYHIKQSIDQPGKVANPARGQLNRENTYFSVPVRA